MHCWNYNAWGKRHTDAARYTVPVDSATVSVCGRWHQLHLALQVQVIARLAQQQQLVAGRPQPQELLRNFSALIASLQAAGLPGAALYPGSWSEWCADAALKSFHTTCDSYTIIFYQ
jgi:hypothetical protein